MNFGERPGKLVGGTPEQQRKYELDFYMQRMIVKTARHWCGSELCACLGCANRSGGLAEKGFTREEWVQWWAEHQPK